MEFEINPDELRKKYADDTPGQSTEIEVADHLKGNNGRDALNRMFELNIDKVKRSHQVNEEQEILDAFAEVSCSSLS